MPGARHVVVEGAAHGGPLTHGPQIAEPLVGFLGEHAAARVSASG